MGIRGRLILLILGVITAMLSIGLIDLYRVWQFNRIQLNDSLKKRTELAAVAFEQWANSQQEPLATLAEIIEDKPVRSIIIGSNLAYLLETRPNWLSLQIVDENGVSLASLNKGKEPPKSLVEDLLKKIKEKKSWVLAADRTENEERPFFTIATPTKDGGAVIAQIDGEAVKALFNDIELAEHSVVAIFNKDGKILYRRSSDNITVSSEIIGSSLIKSLGNEKIAVTEIESPYDGIERVYGLARTEKTENVVIIGISSRKFYEPLWNQIYRQLSVGFIIFLAAIGITLLLALGILRSIRNLKEATNLFAAGDKQAKAPEDVGGELGELGRAFNEMARQINEREEKLKELDNLKSEFVSSVSHELKTPLTTIKTLAHVLKGDKITSEEKTEYLEVIEAECNRQILLVSNILDVSQIESGKYQYETSEINLEQVLKEVYQLEKSAANLKSIALELEITNKLPTVNANAEALHRVFRSLVENAVKYTPEGGNINISTEIFENEVSVSVSDNGCGILTDDLPYIFDKFYRGRPHAESLETVTSTNGVGLGLYVTKKIVEQIGGKIEAATGLSGGTVFLVYLPLWKEFVV